MNLAQFESDLDAHFDRMYAEHCKQLDDNEVEDDEPDCFDDEEWAAHGGQS